MASKFNVVVYGTPVLRKKATLVKVVDDSIRRLAADMLETMYASNGIGLAAEQVGHTESICVIDVPKKRTTKDGQEEWLPDAPDIPMPVVMLNPKIILASGEVVDQEGCLSFPEIYINVRRAAHVTVVYNDLAGNEQTVQARGLFSRAIQHELDHLNAILLVDYMSPVIRLTHTGRLNRLKKQARGK